MIQRPRLWLGCAILAVTSGFLSVWTFNAETLQSSPVPENNPRELYHLAGDQIAAFRRDDFTTAYTFAANGIRERFPLNEFRNMVRQTYPHLTQTGRLDFGETQFAANLHASAMIYVSNGIQSVPMIYAFVREQGRWKIEGVQMLRSSAPSLSMGEPRT